MKVLTSYNKDQDKYAVWNIDTDNLVMIHREMLSSTALVEKIYMGEDILNASAVCGELRLSGSIDKFTEPTTGVVVLGRDKQYYIVTDGEKVWRDTLSSISNKPMINAKLTNIKGKHIIELKRGSLPCFDTEDNGFSIKSILRKFY